jgi:hypothetical protein
MQGVMIVYAVFAGIVILIFVIIAAATIVLWTIERIRKRNSGAANSHDHGAEPNGVNRRLRI